MQFTQNIGLSIAVVAIGLALAGCGGGGTDEAPEPLGMLDFRPTSEFGLEAAITGLRLGKQVVDARAPDDGVARAEGYRYLLRQIEMNLAMLSAETDPWHPDVTRCPSKNCRLGFDNPDYAYVGVNPLSADVNYRLYGNRGSSELFLMQVLERSDGPFKGTSRTHSDVMQFDTDGNWEIFLGAKKPQGVPQGNFLELQEEQATLLIRITHNDWLRTEEPSVHIEVLDSVNETPEPYTPMRMATAGFVLSKMVPNQLQRWVKRLQDAPMNGVDKPCQSWGNYCKGEGGFGNWATGGQYSLEDDQALIIEVPSVAARYYNIQLGNIWAESQDYANRQTSLNGHQVHVDSDNRIRYVLAHRDPGVPNWLDVSGHPEGSLFMRWVFPEDEAALQQPDSHLVEFEDLRQHLPADTPAISRQQRAAVLKERRWAYNRRMNPAGTAVPLD